MPTTSCCEVKCLTFTVNLFVGLVAEHPPKSPRGSWKEEWIELCRRLKVKWSELLVLIPSGWSVFLSCLCSSTIGMGNHERIWWPRGPLLCFDELFVYSDDCLKTGLSGDATRLLSRKNSWNAELFSYTNSQPSFFSRKFSLGTV